MKKRFFTLLMITITIQGYSQTSQQYFHDLRNYFMSLQSESSEIRNRFMDLAQYSSWNSGEHQNMGQGNLANNWNNIRDRFNDLEMHFNDSRNYFSMIEYKFHEIGNLLGNFDGSYPSLTDRIFYYDSNNNNGIYSNQGNTATGTFSFAIGSSTSASGSSAVSLNHQTAATGNASLAIGSTTQSIGENSFAGGLSTQSTGYSSAALGRETVASGNHSLSIGQGTNSHAFNSMALGQYNSVSTTANPDTYLTTNTALVIGNGTDTNNRSNAFKVLFDGTTTIAGDLSINSDARLKANIVSLGATLSKLLKIDGKSYTMKKDKSEKQKIGLLAQDIEKVFPELVSESNGIKSVNYQGLVPVLINALKEQDVMMKEQQRILSEQQSELDELKSMMKKIIER